MAELVDAMVSNTIGEIHVGSTPTNGTKLLKIPKYRDFLFLKGKFYYINYFSFQNM